MGETKKKGITGPKVVKASKKKTKTASKKPLSLIWLSKDTVLIPVSSSLHNLRHF